jgi:hypothetical protein
MVTGLRPQKRMHQWALLSSRCLHQNERNDTWHSAGSKPASGRPSLLTDRPLLSAWRLQHRSQSGCARARGRDFGRNSVTQLYAVKAVTVVSNAFDGMQVYYGMSSNLDKRLAT